MAPGTASSGNCTLYMLATGIATTSSTFCGDNDDDDRGDEVSCFAVFTRVLISNVIGLLTGDRDGDDVSHSSSDMFICTSEQGYAKEA